MRGDGRPHRHQTIDIRLEEFRDQKSEVRPEDAAEDGGYYSDHDSWVYGLRSMV
jgi:hypothetical protein